LIETERRHLPHSRLEPEQNQSGVARFFLNSCEQRPSHPATAGGITDVHPLYLGKVRKQRHSAAAHRYAVRARQKEPDVRLEDRIQG